MKTEAATFHSDGLKLAGSFFLPDHLDGSGPYPIVVPCSGFTGLCSIHPARFARYLTARGHLCFGFDYRGFGGSEGQRGRVRMEEQVRDIVHAVSFAAGDPRVDANRIILLGWGMAGGLVLDAARLLNGVIGVIAVNGFYNGVRMQRAHRSPGDYAEFRRVVAADRGQRARQAEMHYVDPFVIYPLDPHSRRYVDDVLRKTPDYDTKGYTFELADSMLSWNVEAHAPHMHVPLLIAHGDQNALHPPSEAQALYDAYAGPKTLYWLEGAGHTEFMHDDDPKFQRLAGQVEQWIRRRAAGD